MAGRAYRPLGRTVQNMYISHHSGLEYFHLKHYVHTFVELGQPDLPSGCTPENAKRISIKNQRAMLTSTPIAPHRNPSYIQKGMRLQVHTYVHTSKFTQNIPELSFKVVGTSQCTYNIKPNEYLRPELRYIL